MNALMRISLALAVTLTAGCSRAPAHDSRADTGGSSAAQANQSAPISKTGERASGQVAPPAEAGPVERSVRIPLVPGLTVVTAIVMSGVGDAESVKQITTVDDTAVALTYSADIPDNGLGALVGGASGEMRHARGRRRVMREDLERGREYMHLFGAGMPQTIPGATALGVSTAVLADLKGKGGSSALTMRGSGIGTALGGLISAVGGSDFSGVKEIRDLDSMDKLSGAIKRVEPDPVPVRVLVNGRPVNLPAIHAHGTLGDRDGDFYFLDDPANPLALKWKFGDDELHAIKIAFPSENAAEAGSARIEADLAERGRAEVYGIYFDFDSDVLRPESQPVLEEIAGTLRDHPDWKLNVEGHTDNVGTDAHNLDLSRRRAAAVKQALVERYHTDGEKLAPAGFGASRPKDTNDTVEGRARNRRVELARQQ